jgi:hypothetical protein
MMTDDTRYRAKQYTEPFSVNGKIYLPGTYSFEEHKFATTLMNDDESEPLSISDWNKRYTNVK